MFSNAMIALVVTAVALAVTLSGLRRAGAPRPPEAGTQAWLDACSTYGGLPRLEKGITLCVVPLTQLTK